MASTKRAPTRAQISRPKRQAKVPLPRAASQALAKKAQSARSPQD